MLGLATISFVLLLVVVYFVARPWLVPQLEGSGVRAVEVRDRRDRLAATLTDLDMEFSTGKLAVEDYESQREQREQELEAAESELDELDSEDVPASSEDDADPDDELERLIAARRRELAQTACPDCGAPHDPDDRFCRSCGTELSEVTST
ncbi:MAG: zinc ribbon domain-containing protein [Actinomycetota bacterium]